MSAVFAIATSPVDPGLTLIEASAGTGKTFTIAHLVARLLLDEPDLTLDQVLVVTFTNAAAAELAARIRAVFAACLQALGHDEADGAAPLLIQRARSNGANDEALRRRLRLLLIDLDRLAVGTIHGFCKRVLDQAAFESGMPFATELLLAETPLLTAAVADVWRAHLYPDALLAALAVSEEWTIEDDVRLYRLARLHPDCRIEPAPALDVARAAFIDAQRAFAVVWDHAAFARVVATWTLNKNTPLHQPECAQVLNALAAFARDATTLAKALSALHAITPTALTKALNKVGAKNKSAAAVAIELPCVRAAGAVVAALAQLGYAWRAALPHAVDGQLERAKKVGALLTSDDLLRRLRAALHDAERGPALIAALRARHRVAFIDEFQDTDPTQWDIFRTLFEDSPQRLVLIGDPKQAIYAFRGADLRAYLSARTQAAATGRVFHLGTNFRSSPALVAAMNALFSGSRPFLDPGLSYQQMQSAGRTPDAGASALTWWVPAESPRNKDDAQRAIDAWVGAGLARLIAAGTAPGACAVLVRTNDQAVSLGAHLRTLGIPAVVAGGGDVLDTDTAREVALILHAVLSPRRAEVVRAALATVLLGGTAADLLALESDETRWQTVLEHCAEAAWRWQQQGIVAALDGLLNATWWPGRAAPLVTLATRPGAERTLTDLRHLGDWLHRLALSEHLPPLALVRRLVPDHDDPERSERDLRLETDAEAVAIVTVHKAKGLEYDVVFCPYLWAERPEQGRHEFLAAADDGVVLDLGQDSPARDLRLAQADAERLAEDLRLLYVAVTRARSRLFVVWGDLCRKGTTGAGSAARTSALGYLLHTLADADETDERDAAERWAETRMHLAADDCDPLAGVRSLIGAQPTLMTLEQPDAEAVVLTPLPEPTTPIEFTARAWSDRAVALTPWSIASYTSLTRARRAVQPVIATSSDQDEAEDVTVAPVIPSTPVAALVGMAAFARGADAGIAVHAVLEQTDFSVPLANDAVAEILALHGFAEPARHRGAIDPAAAVADMLRVIARTPLPGGYGGFALADTERTRRLSEWTFTLPLARLTPAALAQAFAAAGGEWALAAPALAALALGSVRGFLTGVVDLLVEHHGRWHLLDWKSNYLGATPAAYDHAGLTTAMVGGQYLLQAALYALALHRFLRTRLRAYAYDRHVGGLWYGFVRGIDGSAEHGWFAERVPEALTISLENLLEPVRMEIDA